MNFPLCRPRAAKVAAPPRSRRPPQSLGDAWMALTGLSAVFLFEMLDNSILNVALPTIGRDVHASTAGLQWVTSSYAVLYGGMMMAFGALADRIGRRKIMLFGLLLLGATCLATPLVRTLPQLIVLRSAMGIAASMTTPGSLALAFRLFDEDRLRVRATTLISTVGLVGLAIGPTVGGFVLAIAPWQSLLLVNVPTAAISFVGIARGIPADKADELHDEPIDIPGALLGTTTIMCALVAPTFFVDLGMHSVLPWATLSGAALLAVLFALREHATDHPLLDVKLVAQPLVSSGLAFKAAAGLATASLGYLVTLQLQLAWAWTPAQAAMGMLPQVVVLIAGGAIIDPLIRKVGIEKASWLCAAATVCGLAVYTLMGHFGYAWVVVALVLVAGGMRVVGVVAGTNALRGLPKDRTTTGAAMVDTASELTTGIGIAVSGTILAALFTGDVAVLPWTAAQGAEFTKAVTVAGVAVTGIAAGLVGWGVAQSRRGTDSPTMSSGSGTGVG